MDKKTLKYKPSLSDVFVKPIAINYEDTDFTIYVEAKKEKDCYTTTLFVNEKAMLFYLMFDYEECLVHLNAMIEFMSKNPIEIIKSDEEALLKDYREFFDA